MEQVRRMATWVGASSAVLALVALAGAGVKW
jgi:hypothetical protein